MFIESKFILTKLFPRGVSKINFGRYEISPLSLYSSTEIEAMLSFSRNHVNSGMTSHPEEEVDIVCKLLSLFLNTRIRKVGTTVDDTNIPVFDGRERQHYPQFFGYLEPQMLDDLMKRTLSLDENTARQFIRACRCYSYALELIPSDPSFASFLLVAAAQCLSSQDTVIPFSEMNPVKQAAERFCHFIIRYMPTELKGGNGKDSSLYTELLSNAFTCSNDAFVNGRESIVRAAKEADKKGVNFSEASMADKTIKIPGLSWLSQVVRGALVGYILSLTPPSAETINEDLFSKLTLGKAELQPSH